jgi:hypothetical protein
MAYGTKEREYNRLTRDVMIQFSFSLSLSLWFSSCSYSCSYSCSCYYNNNNLLVDGFSESVCSIGFLDFSLFQFSKEHWTVIKTSSF